VSEEDEDLSPTTRKK